MIRERRLTDTDIINDMLKLALIVIGATDTAIGDRWMAKTDIIWRAALTTVAGQTIVGMLGQYQLKESLP